MLLPAEGPIKGWKIKVVDTNERHPLEGTWSNLDGRELHFRSRTKPAARYLHFHYVVAILRAQRHRPKDWIEPMMKEMAWGAPGRYMLRSMLQALTRHAGHDTPQEVSKLEFNIIETGPPSAEADALAQKLIRRTSTSEEDAEDDNDSDSGEIEWEMGFGEDDRRWWSQV